MRKRTRMKQAISLLLTLTLALGTASAVCAEEEVKSLRIGATYDASTLDPSMATDDASYDVVRLIGEGLLRMVDGEPVAGIAESWESSEDGLTWTFHLRESVYSDGTPVTANDFAYQIVRALDPNNALDMASEFYSIVNGEAFNAGEATEEDLGIEVVDDYTLTLTFLYPQYEQSFTDFCYMPVNQELAESLKEAYGAEAENVLTNGPFTVTEWVHDSEIVLTKNENYWNADAILLDEIHIYAGASDDTAADMMLAGELDAGQFTTANGMNAVLESGGFESLEMLNGINFMHLNHNGMTEETGKWLSNVNFRKALSAALDREALVATVYTTDVAASSIISPSEMGVSAPLSEEYDTGSWSTTADAEAAQEYLAAAMEELGVSDVSEIPTFTMLAYDSQSNVICLNAVADMWYSTLGINCTLDMVPITDMLSRATSGEYDFWKGGQAVNMDSIDGDPLYDYTAEYNDPALSYFDDDEYNTLFTETRAQSDWSARKEGIAALACHFADNMMDLAITWSGIYSVYSENVSGITITNGYIDYTFADIVG